MEHQNYLYTSGEFAKLTGINRRTLHYYNDIGLFCPKIIAQNGYHYYTCFQFAQLELILTLRKIGLSIDEIRSYMTHSSDQYFSQMVEKKKKLIDESINQLLSVQNFLEQKAARLELGAQARHGSIELCTLPEKKIILSSPISGRYDQQDFSVAAAFSLRLKKLFHLYDSFGSRISVQAITQGEFHCYDSFYAYCPCTSKAYDEMIPSGMYLRAFCVGAWEKLPEVYRAILIYAKKHHLTLTGYAYEEGLNEIAIQNQDDYITMITIHCENNL